MELKIMKASLLALAVVLAAMVASPAFAKTPHPECDPNYTGKIPPGHGKHGDKFCDPELDATSPETFFTTELIYSEPMVFAFDSTEAGSTFECRLDTEQFDSSNPEGFEPCTSPQIFDLGPSPSGYWFFAVRAIDPAGNIDPTPANTLWTEQS